MKTLSFQAESFEGLTTSELYEILVLRAEVFVVEQNCVYQDIDNLDQQALHVFAKIDEKIMAYARIFQPEIYFKEAAIGRVVVSNKYRNRGFAHQLMDYSISQIEKQFETQQIRISAQTHLTKFYNAHGFEIIGDEYLEDGIPHTNMIKI